MKIAIDVRKIGDRPAGKGVYVINLLREFTRLNRLHTVLLFSDRKIALPFRLPKNFKRRIEPGWGPFWHQRLSVLLEDEKVNAFFSPLSYLTASISSVPTVLVVHDLVSFTHPETSTLRVRLTERLALPRAVRRAAAIICDSQATRRELVDQLGLSKSELDHDRIKVVALGVDHQFHRVVSPVVWHHLESTYRLSRRYILFVGTLEPRKNIGKILEAYWLLDKKLKDRYQLVLCGQKGWKYREIFAAIRDLGLSDRVLWLDYVSKGDLSALYSFATIFVMPSLSEGFGMPILEAMSCGTPVIASNVSALPEVVGEAGLLTDPADPRSIAQAMTTLLLDAKLRNKFRLAGLRRVKNYSWELTADQIWKVICSVGEADRRS